MLIDTFYYEFMDFFSLIIFDVKFRMKLKKSHIKGIQKNGYVYNDYFIY